MVKKTKEQLDEFIKAVNECFAFIDDPNLPFSDELRARLHESYDEVLQKMLDEMSRDDYQYPILEFPKLHKIGHINSDRPKTCAIYDELRQMVPRWFRGDVNERGENDDRRRTDETSNSEVDSRLCEQDDPGQDIPTSDNFPTPISNDGG